MDDLWAALGLLLVLEGAIYALFPRQMIEMMRQLPAISPSVIRMAGLSAIALGWLLVKYIRG
ncbi:MAG: DUF2065 domain-containing protein [Zetaproteobacteria bacterium CG_4_9_14_3_um_filter_53_7]|nr:MAG: DUF2065 domain-containing protein [Zetaproteobacteria bacterium CG_4_9_14_3_um_filter_53_7]